MRVLPVRLVLAVLFVACAARFSAAGEADPTYFTPTYRLVFFAVLEGCFEDGLTDADVDQILLNPKPDSQRYEHFIYACPICMPTVHALETYRHRPAPYGAKMPGERTFGPGLTPALHDRLYSADIKERLSAIHDLEEEWLRRRVASLRLDAEEAAHVQDELLAARKKGLEVMQSFEQRGMMDAFAPGYHAGDECAVCNAATGMKLKLADGAAR